MDAFEPESTSGVLLVDLLFAKTVPRSCQHIDRPHCLVADDCASQPVPSVVLSHFLLVKATINTAELALTVTHQAIGTCTPSQASLAIVPRDAGFKMCPPLLQTMT